MRILSLVSEGRSFLGVRRGRDIIDLNAELPSLPAHLGEALRTGACNFEQIAEVSQRSRAVVDPEKLSYRCTVSDPSKIFCLGANFVDPSGPPKPRPEYPIVFGRWSSSFVGHEQPMVLPAASSQLDYEAELVVVIGRGGRHIARERALAHVLGYTLMNDGSARDVQARAQQWTLGKSFDASGSIGPELVTADELPPGALGLTLSGRLNGETMQHASTSDMIFDVASAVSIISEVVTLTPGDLIAMGTPGGVGSSRSPQRFLRPGDVYEVELSGLGVLRNRMVAEERAAE